MPESESSIMIYSVQRTYILTDVTRSEKRIITCDQRIDIPTIEPLLTRPVGYNGNEIIVPCIELAGDFLAEFDLTFETNEGVTVLPIKIDPMLTPYLKIRYVLVLPRGATGVKSCKLIHKATGKELQHNFTFGIMPPPYNYDNMLFGYSQFIENELFQYIESRFSEIGVISNTTEYPIINLPKGDGEQSILRGEKSIYFTTAFSYPPTSEVTEHHPVISVYASNGKHSYTLSLNRTSQTVLVDLLMSMITVYDSGTGEIMQQFKLPLTPDGFDRVSFNHFDDIDGSALKVEVKGRPVK